LQPYAGTVDRELVPRLSFFSWDQHAAAVTTNRAGTVVNGQVQFFENDTNLSRSSMGQIMSPAQQALHEIGHILEAFSHPRGFVPNPNKADPYVGTRYTDSEEFRNINDVETPAGLRFGEPTRDNHATHINVGPNNVSINPPSGAIYRDYGRFPVADPTTHSFQLTMGVLWPWG